MSCLDTLQARRELCAGKGSYSYYALDVACSQLNLDIDRLPFVHRILLENLLRHEDGYSVKLSDLKKFAEYVNSGAKCEINFMPVRVMMQDFTGVPALVDLAAMRDYMRMKGKDPSIINPRIPVDLVIDHSLQVDFSGTDDALSKNVTLEMSRNLERYRFLKWSQQAFRNLRVVPPGMGICHQVNLEYLAQVVWNVDGVLCPDTIMGTDSHTTMINGISVLGWGVGGIEAEAAMLGQPIAMTVPEVVGFEISGKLREGVTATDMVLTITDMLRRKKVVGKFVEFYGDGLKNLTVFDRATVANMAPEYGATCGFFPFDQSTLDYLDITGRDRDYMEVIESYIRAQHLWYQGDSVDYSDRVELDLGDVYPVVAGPKRPQDRIDLSKIADTLPKGEFRSGSELLVKNGDVVIAAITSCTNTSNPYVMIAAGLVARKARKLGLRSKPWVKTSLTPGSQVVEAYLKESGLQQDLNHLGFNIVGYGCATCIGNSGPLAKEIEDCIAANNLLVVSVLSGNRNFEGRVHPCVKANFLASPPVVVLFSLSGTVLRDITKDAICQDSNGNDVFLEDLWPTNEEISEIIGTFISREVFLKKYANVFLGDEIWQNVKSVGDVTYEWSSDSTYVQKPPYFVEQGDPALQRDSQPNGKIRNNELDIRNARILMLLGDSITTDHISPAGNISIKSPAGKFLTQQGVAEKDFNSYGSRRGNHNIMMRGTFANIRIKNEILAGVEGGFTRHFPSGEMLSIYDAAMRYGAENVPLVVVAGKEYGTGSSRDWAAKGTILLGIKAVIAESFERIHRSNLVGMGVLPLIFKEETRSILTGEETLCLSGQVGVRKTIECEIHKSDGSSLVIDLECAVNTAIELDYLAVGGVLHYVLKRMVSDTP
ncbi:aconitate hydratase A [Anaplasma platys]|uniref:Aconitate hydratase n=1 Tax=Anaplasma platys TaxID=949 RepID=A0A858PZ59_9RICK|nr:aconitate hydratase AcnA [Anaplasma platys]QJC27844.1 aconitate hydratase A [Anaplasma platys]